MKLKRLISSLFLVVFGFGLIISCKYQEDYNNYVESLSELKVLEKTYTYLDLGFSELKYCNFDFNTKTFLFCTKLEDKNKITNIVNEWNNLPEHKNKRNAYIKLQKQGQPCVVIPTIYPTLVDLDKTIQQVDLLVLNKINEVDYESCKLDKQEIVTTEQANKEADKLNNIFVEYTNGTVVYLTDYMISKGETVIKLQPSVEYKPKLNKDTLSLWLQDYLTPKLESYVNIGSTWDFTTTYNKQIKINGGTFGVDLDMENEILYICDLFSESKCESNRKPLLIEYGGENIGDSYVEVSIADQHMWTYINGKLVLDSNVVTGLNTQKSRRTHTGVWYISFMQKNRTLRGTYGTSFVNRWMRFTPDGQGLHDATWRYNFGGNIYQYSGSHGCVNLPKSKAYELYDIAYVGMPVIVY